MIFSKSNLVLYLPMNGNLTELVANYTATNTGADLTTDQDSISNMAYDFAQTGDRISFISSVGNAICTQLNDRCSILFNLSATNNDSQFRLFNQDNAITNQRYLSITRLASANQILQLFTGTGSSVTTLNSNNNAFLKNTWQRYCFTTNDNNVNLDVSFFRVTTNYVTGTLAYSGEAGTSTFRIGASETANVEGAFGKMNNLQVHKKVLTPQEQFFANKFRNKKRVVS